MLVLGYEGTLRPLAGSAAATAELPPCLEELLTHWLEAALRELEHRIPRTQRLFQGEPIPLASLLLLLKRRLAGILTQAVAWLVEDADYEPLQISNQLRRQFPALDPLMRSTVAEWVAAVATFLNRLHRDAPAIAAAQKLAELPPLESIEGTASDVHAGGHPVLRVCFAGGACWYYKPRRVTGEWLWHALLESIAAVAPELQLPRARVVAPGRCFTYGWMEPLDGACAPSESYWQAAGALLCLAQHVRMTDLHLGNIVATAMGPAVADAECLGTPQRATAQTPTRAAVEAPLARAVRDILATGLLPSKDSSNQPDVSGLFGYAAAIRGIALPQWSVSPDGRYRLHASAAVLLAHNHAPLQAPAKASPIAVLPAVLNGYRQAAEALLRARAALLTTDSPWRRVLEQAHAPRVVVRDTLRYGRLLSRSLRPQHLHSANGRRKAILSMLQAEPPAGLPAALLRMEAHALLQGHVPRCMQLPGSRSLAASSGRPVVRCFTDRPAAQTVIHQLRELSREGLEEVLIPALLTSILESRLGMAMC